MTDLPTDPPAPDIAALMDRLRGAAMAYPATREDHPWGESAFKVREKTFLFMSYWGGGVSLTMKLPVSFEFACEYPFVKPSGYGLGRGRWVTVRIMPDEEAPFDILLAWLDESFVAVAPKKLAAIRKAPAG